VSTARTSWCCGPLSRGTNPKRREASYRNAVADEGKKKRGDMQELERLGMIPTGRGAWHGAADLPTLAAAALRDPYYVTGAAGR